MIWFKQKNAKTKTLPNNTNYLTQELDSKVKEFHPKKYNDVELIAKTLMLQKSVQINLQETGNSERKRIMDFLSGVIFILDLDVKKLNTDIYLIQTNNK